MYYSYLIIINISTYKFAKKLKANNILKNQTIVCTREHFCVHYFSKPNNKTAEKIMGQYFPIKSSVTCKNLTHFEAPKKLTKIVSYASTVLAVRPSSLLINMN